MQKYNTESIKNFFKSAEKDRSKHASALEMELIGFEQNSRKRVGYEKIKEILLFFQKDFNYSPYYEDDNIVELRHETSNISLEPGMQIEFGSHVKKSLFDLESELRTFSDRLKFISDELDVRWLATGYDPFSKLEDIPWVPKKRYAVMREFLPLYGERILNMMVGTAGSQLNIDYMDESDMSNKMMLTNSISMVVSAIFANSSMLEGKISEFASYRNNIWNHVDSNRSGYVESSLQESFGYDQYINYLASIPMVVIERNQKLVDVRGENFVNFMNGGRSDISPSEKDWFSQMSFTFPFARLRHTIETRTTDTGTVEHIMAMAAFWKGLLYSPKTLSTACAKAKKYNVETLYRLALEAPRNGMKTAFGDFNMAIEAEFFLNLAHEGLREQAPEEIQFLNYARKIVEEKESVAERMIRLASGKNIEAEEFIRTCGLEVT